MSVAIDIHVMADDLARCVNAFGKGPVDGRWIVESVVGAAAVEEAVDAAGVAVISDDLACIIDTGRSASTERSRIRNVRVNAAVIQKAGDTWRLGCITPDDLAYVIDGSGLGVRGERVIESCIAAASVEEAVARAEPAAERPGRESIIADDLAVVVDAGCIGSSRILGIVESDERVGHRNSPSQFELQSCQRDRCGSRGLSWRRSHAC
jgi:hypothetical protein